MRKAGNDTRGQHLMLAKMCVYIVLCLVYTHADECQGGKGRRGKLFEFDNLTQHVLDAVRFVAMTLVADFYP